LTTFLDHLPELRTQNARAWRTMGPHEFMFDTDTMHDLQTLLSKQARTEDSPITLAHGIIRAWLLAVEDNPQDALDMIDACLEYAKSTTTH
jgi:hypothetical protein